MPIKELLGVEGKIRRLNKKKQKQVDYTTEMQGVVLVEKMFYGLDSTNKRIFYGIDFVWSFKGRLFLSTALQ